jgi:long-chain acyl-CoA synthetase
MFDLNLVIERLKDSRSTFEYYESGQRKTLPFNALYNDVVKIATWMRSKGIRKGSKVGILGRNSYGWVVCDLACLACTSIVVPLDPSRKHDVGEIVKAYGLELLLTNTKDFAGSNIVFQFSDVLSLEWPATGFEIGRYAPDDVFTFNFTSGTSGTPKAIELKKKSFDHLVSGSQLLFDFNSRDKFLVFLPLNIYLERCYIYAAILIGFNIVLTPLEFIKHSMKNDKATVLVGIPYFFENVYRQFMTRISEKWYYRVIFLCYTLLKRLGIAKRFRPFTELWGGHMRYMLTGSAPSDLKVLQFYDLVGLPLYEGYGMNEVGGMIALNSPGNRRLGSVGIAFPGKTVAFDENSQIIVESQFHANDHYYNGSEEENRKTYLDHNKVATGDIGYADKDGYIYIQGRTSEMLILSNGHKVHPTQLESKLSNSSLIDQCLVLGDRKPFLSAIVIPRRNGTIPNEEAIRQEVLRINANLPAHESILHIHIALEPFTIENGLVTSSLKLNRNAIIARYQKEIGAIYN